MDFFPDGFKDKPVLMCEESKAVVFVEEIAKIWLGSVVIHDGID